MTIPRTVKVYEIMTREVQTCGPDESLNHAARLMWEHDCGCLPVVGGDGRVVGMITDRDVCMAAYTQGLPLHAIPVRTAMAKQVHVCRSDDAVLVAERIMREHRVRRLPVVAADGVLAGILSLNDVAQEAAREHQPATREVSAEGLVETLAAVCGPRAR